MAKSPSLKKFYRWVSESTLLPLYCVAVLMRMLCVAVVPKYPDNEPGYIAAGWFVHTQQGHGYWREIPGDGLFWTAWVAPLYAYLESLIFFFVQHDYFHMRLVTVTLLILTGALNCVLIFHIAKNFGMKRGWAMLCAWILAFHPTYCLWTTRLHPHTLLNFLLVLFMYLVSRDWVKPSKKLIFFAGVTIALAALARGEAAALWIPVAVWWFFQKQKGLFKQRMLFFALGGALAIAPWVIRNYKLHNTFILTATNIGENLALVHNPDYYVHDPFTRPVTFWAKVPMDKLKTEVEVNRYLTRESIQYILDHPGQLFHTTLFHFLHYWQPYLTPRAVPWSWNILYITLTFPPLVFFFVGIGLFRRPDTGWFPMWGMVVWMCLIHLPFYMLVRFRENVFPFIFLVAMMAFQHVLGPKLKGLNALLEKIYPSKA